MKIKVTLLIIAFSLIISLSAFAVSDSLPAGVESTVFGILSVTNPNNVSISSFDKVHNISGYAANGAQLAIYILNGGTYQLMYRNGAPVTCTIGASGMFVQPVSLNHGRNDLLISATLNGQAQYTRRTITILSSNFLNLLKGFNLF